MAVPTISDEFISRVGRITNYNNLLGIRAPDPNNLATFTAPTNGLPTELANTHIDLRGFLNSASARATTQNDLASLHQWQNAYVQTLSVNSIPDAGSFIVTFIDENDEEHGILLPYDIARADLETQLKLLTSANIVVAGATFPYLINFDDDSSHVPLLEVDSIMTSGGSPVIATINLEGNDFKYMQTADIDDITKTQDQLAVLSSIRTENWLMVSDNYTAADIEVGPINTFNYWNGLRLTFQSGRDINTTVLISNSQDRPINIRQLETNIADIEISLALPGLNSLPLDFTQTTVQFTSHGLGEFGKGADSVAIPMAGNTFDSGGYVEFKKGLDSFDTASVNWTHITAIKITLVGSGTLALGQFILLGIRAFSKIKLWVPTTLDVNTITEKLVRPVPRNGNTDTSTHVRVPSILRANLSVPSGVEDPRPSDGSLAIKFFTGSLDSVGTQNIVHLYFRENRFSANHAEWMVAELRFGKSFVNLKRYMVRRLESGGNYTDEIIGSISETAQSANLAPLEDEKPLPGTFAPFKANTNYLMQAEVINNGFRIGIFEMDTNGVVNFTHQETTLEYKPEWLRRAGRVGFYVDPVDEDVTIEYFRSSSTAFSIFRTSVFRSRTPVDGAQLYVSSSGPRQLFNDLLFVRSGDIITTDSTKNPSGGATTWRITSSGTETNAGARTNPIHFEDWDNMTVEFDIWLPADMARSDGGKRPRMYFLDPADNGNLLGASVIGPLDINAIANGFTHNKINLSLYKFKPAGVYEVFLVYETPHANTWWISDMQVTRRTVSWEFRARANAEWIPFHDMINNPKRGLHLGRALRGTEMQLQARALTQDAWIAEYRLVPRYAQLGLISAVI